MIFNTHKEASIVSTCMAKSTNSYRSSRKAKNVSLFFPRLCFYWHMDKVSNFIQQLDAGFGGEEFTNSSMLSHVSMYLERLACKW